MAQGVWVQPSPATTVTTVSGVTNILVTVPLATITVCQFTSAGIPCAPTAPLCTDSTCAVQSSPNPFTADAFGNFGFWILPGNYKFQIASPGAITQTYNLTAAPSSITITTLSGNLTFTGNNTHSGTEAFSGPVNITGPLAVSNTAAFSGVTSFTNTVTHSGTETFTGSTLVKSLNKIQFADQFPGATADAQITAAEAALPTGGTVDARGYGCSTQTIANPLAIGSATQQITLIIDRCTQFNVTVTGGVDAIQLWIESALEALDMGNVQAVGNFVIANTANIANLIASYPRAGPTILNIRGVTLKGNASATVTGAMLDLAGATDHTTVQDVIGYNFTGPGLRIQNVTGVPAGPINIVNNSWNGSGLAGAKPVQINCVAGGGVIADINFFGGSLTHPGTGGLAMLDIEGTTTNCINGVGLYGVQFESINAGDIGVNIVNGLGVTGSDLVFTTAGTNGTSCIKLTQSGALTHTIVFDNITNFNGWTNTIQDTINSVNITDARLARYTYLPPTTNASGWYSTACGGLCFGMTNQGLSANAAGWKSLRSVSGCATAASLAATCDTTVTWTTAFPDGNYTPQCIGYGITSGVPLNGGITIRSGASVIFRTVSGTAAAAQYQFILCSAVHD